MIVLFGGKFAEGFICANDKDQAISLCFTGCRRVLEASPLFGNEVRFTQDRIHFIATQSSITAIANAAAGLAGVHPCISVHDELWAAPPGGRGRAVFDQLIPVPSRRISARLVVSHAGFADPDHLLYQLYQRGLAQPQIGTDLYAGDGLLMHWSHSPLHVWQDERWQHMMRRELLPNQYAYMIENRFVINEANFATGEQWDACVTLPAPPPSNPMMPVFIGVDASVKRDSTAIVVVNGEKDGGVRIDDHKVFVPGANSPISFEVVEKVLLDLKKKYPLCTIVFDTNQLAYLMQRLTKAGVKCEEFVQSPANISAMTQNLDDLVRYKKLQAYPSQQLRHAITHALVTENTMGIRLAKNKDQKDHVDLVTALAMAALRCVQRFTTKPSYRLDVFDENFKDEDLPPEIEPELKPLRANDHWHEGVRKAPRMNDADANLKSLYQGLDSMIQYGPQPASAPPWRRR
jgi:hypothetical protein